MHLKNVDIYFFSSDMLITNKFDIYVQLRFEIHFKNITTLYEYFLILEYYILVSFSCNKHSYLYSP